jgi:c-di-GMP-binding flagellar brake protein YcgR
MEAGRTSAAVKNVISMDVHVTKGESRSLLVRDRRYAIRHPFAADVEFIDLEAGNAGKGVTSDLSLGGCFVCTSKPLALNSRVKLRLTRKEQVVEALAVVRIVKPRIGMGIEFLDVEGKDHGILDRWLEQLRRER